MEGCPDQDIPQVFCTLDAIAFRLFHVRKQHFLNYVFVHSTLLREVGLYLWAVLATAFRFSEEMFVGIAHSGLMRRIPAFRHCMTSWDTETGFP